MRESYISITEIMMKTANKTSVQIKDRSSTSLALNRAANRCVKPMTEALEARTLYSVFSVTSNADDGPGSLRQAIIASNTAGGSNTITFNLCAGQTTIIVASALPAVTTPTFINGTSEPGYAGTPLIMISGSALLGDVPNNGLTISASNSTVSGLSITSFFDGAAVEMTGNNDVVDTDFLGVDTTGGTPSTFPISTGFADANLLGVSADGTNGIVRNSLLSNNFTSGVKVTGNGTQVYNDKIGTDVTGAVALGNLGDGVLVVGAANVNIGVSPNNCGYGGCGYGGCGPSPVVTHNIISNNSGDGVRLVNPGANDNIAGNYVGTDVTGIFAMANFGNGIDVSNTSVLGANDGVTIGGFTVSSRNVIGTNFGDGIELHDVSGTSIMSNYIGTDMTGKAALPNGGDGVHVVGESSSTSVGGWCNTGNVISGNFGDGVEFDTDSTTTGNTISGNFIGTDISGRFAVPNFGDGVSASNNIQIGTCFGGNLISGNLFNGIELTGNSNTVAYNRIGMMFSGTTVGLGNGLSGVLVDGAHNVVGTTSAANIIGFNVGNGVTIGLSQSDTAAIDDSVRGNSIFDDGGLGIDLGDDGENANTPGVHVGPDMDLNHPMLTSAIRSNGKVTIQGTYNGAVLSAYSIDLYANQVADASGYGEGQYYLGTIKITTDANGNASFNVTVNDVPAGWSYVTATATNAAGDTSEFSNDDLITNSSSSGSGCGASNNGGGSCGSSCSSGSSCSGGSSNSGSCNTGSSSGGSCNTGSSGDGSCGGGGGCN